MKATASLFLSRPLGSIPQDAWELDPTTFDLLIDFAIAEQRAQIEAELRRHHLLLSQGGAMAARVAHTHEVGGSSPLPATSFPAEPNHDAVIPSAASRGVVTTARPESFPHGSIESFKSSAPGASENRSSCVSQQSQEQNRVDVSVRVWMCAWCQRPYNERGEYVFIPSWRRPLAWSHGICPSCRLEMLAEATR